MYKTFSGCELTKRHHEVRFCNNTIVSLCGFTLATTPVEEARPQYGNRKSYRVTDRQYLERQKNILRLFRFIDQPSYYKDLVELAKLYSVENNLNSYDDPKPVKQLLYYYTNDILPQGAIFSVFYDEHLQQAIALFKTLYFAKDYDTFYKTAAWARYYLNEGLYLYSLSVAILHRSDTYGIVLPPIYEMYPYYFYNSEVIQKGQNYRHQQQQGGYGNVINANYSGWYLNLNPEQSISYYTEDVGINAYYYYYNLYRPFWLNHNEVYVNSQQRGEEFYYFHQQILARYYLERLSNNKGEISLYDYELPLENGYTPSLRYQNGLEFPSRPNWAQFGKNYYNHGQSYSFKSIHGYSYTLVRDYARRIRDAIDSGYVITQEGQRINLYEPHGFNLLGNIIESNTDSSNTRFYGYLQIFARHLLGYAKLPLHKYKVAPSVLEHYETSLRDPAFYQLYKNLILYFQKYKYYLPQYSYNDLAYPGVKVKDVQIDRLITYFESFDADVGNAISLNQQEYEDDERPQIRIRQKRLNHQPFTYKISVTSENPCQSVVRVYIGPKYDEYGRNIDINDNRINFVELDRFKYSLQTGKNVIVRNSHQIYSGDYAGFGELQKKVQTALNGGDQYYVYGSEVQYTYPNRYLLPKGNYGGQAYQIYVIVSPYKPFQLQQLQQKRQQIFQQHQKGLGQNQEQPYYYPAVGLGVQNIDSYPLGYPFDRPIDHGNFYVPNSYFKDILIHHKNADDINTSAHNIL